jgi:N4-gp56 family major capsid protein
MAGEFSPANSITNTTGAAFIPELWSDEIVATYKRSLVAANLFKKLSWNGKKGDTVNIPVPTRGQAHLKISETQVTLNTNSSSLIPVLIDKHYEYSNLIEDITEVQALASMRRFYTDDAGYALAKEVDTSLIQLGRGFNGGNQANAAYAGGFSGADGTTAYVAGANTGLGALTDAAIRRTIQRMDDNDVPMEGRFFIIPPSSRNTLMGLARYTEQAFVGEVGGNNTIRNGEIGNLYGIPVFVSSNADTTSGTTPARVCIMGHRDSAVLVEQMGVRSQTQYKQEFLATLYTADTLYGVKELRDFSAYTLIVPA